MARNPSEATTYWRLWVARQRYPHIRADLLPPAPVVPAAPASWPAPDDPTEHMRAVLRRHRQHMAGSTVLNLGNGTFRVIDHDARRVTR